MYYLGLVMDGNQNLGCKSLVGTEKQRRNCISLLAI